MQFEKFHIYHIYNQGNNRQKIFFNRENYLFFLWKIQTYILPFADILAWCLMPNHFHLMVVVNETEIVCETHPMTPSHRMSKKRSLNNSIAIMLRSYARAIQKQGLIKGSLFRQKTKAECITCTDGITPSFYNTHSGTQINIVNPEQQYPELCFHYIYQNPVKAGLVKTTTDWEFSSARDYMNLRKGKLVNKEVAKQYIINTNSSDDSESSDE
jgi:putative transposase